MNTFVSAAWLREHIGDPGLTVIGATVIVEANSAGKLQSVSGGANYEAGQIPPAVLADLMGELSNA